MEYWPLYLSLSDSPLIRVCDFHPYICLCIRTDIQKAFCASARPKFKYDDEIDEDEGDIFRPLLKKMKTNEASTSSVIIDLTSEENLMTNICQVKNFHYFFIRLFIVFSR